MKALIVGLVAAALSVSGGAPRYDQARTYTACYVSRCVAPRYGVDVMTGEEVEYEDSTPDIHVGDIIASYVTWDSTGEEVESWDVTLPAATV